MKIELTTTKKKLTISLVNQMMAVGKSGINILKNATVFGFVVNIRRNSYKTVLMEYENNYYVIPMDFVKGTKLAYRKVGKGWTTNLDFATEKECDEWWDAYSAVIEKASTQIYV